MHDVIDAFKALGLHGMASAWPEVLGTARMKSLDHEAVLHQLIKAETAQREVRSMAYQMRVARFPSHRDLAGFDFAHTQLDEALVRQLHDARVMHRSLYPKHLFVRWDSGAEPEVAVIDLEKSRTTLIAAVRTVYDLATLTRHSDYWSRSDRLYFLLQYLGLQRLTPWARRLCRWIVKRAQRKRRD